MNEKNREILEQLTNDDVPKKKKGKIIIPCEVYSRVVGYYRPVQAWNAGKIEEFKDRKEFKVQ